MQAWYWLILFAALLVIEVATMGLTTIWFAGGSLAACVAALLGAGIYLQIGLFLVISIILLLCLRPFANSHLFVEKEKTNVDGLPGQNVLVKETISNLQETGKVLINGIEWTARSEDDGEQIEKDAIVTVLRVEGVKVIVSRLNKKADS